MFRGLWIISAIALAFTISMEVLLGTAEEEWLTLVLIGLLGFLVWSVGLGIVFLLYGR